VRIWDEVSDMPAATESPSEVAPQQT
jgi:hypothetical protein